MSPTPISRSLNPAPGYRAPARTPSPRFSPAPHPRWPKTSLGCLREGVRLSPEQLKLLLRICSEESLALEQQQDAYDKVRLRGGAGNSAVMREGEADGGEEQR